MPATTASDVIRALDLAPHPEGGFFRETFRDPAPTASGRAASTAIYFLLPAGVVSRWHRVDAAEVWHWYAGATLELAVADHPDGMAALHRLGPDVLGGERPQVVVPTRRWQRARSVGAWTLVGCTVAPGFEFQGFELWPDGRDPAEARSPQHK